MRTFFSLATATLFLSAPQAQEAVEGKAFEGKPVEAAQQGLPKPAPELKRLDHMVGSWTGKGVSHETAGKEPIEWTAKIRYEWDYGGHWLVERTLVQFGPNHPDLQFVTFLGWDREHKRYISLGINNMNEMTKLPVLLKPDGTLVTVKNRMMMGQRRVSRSIAQFGKDKGSFKMFEGVDDEKEFLHVQGEHVRSKTPIEMKFVEHSFPYPIPTTKIDKIAGMCGKYTMAGEWAQAPGAPAMPISGKEEIGKIFGGLVLAFHGSGDPAPGLDWSYKGFGAIGWDANKNCYTMIYVNNMGQFGMSCASYDPSSRKMAFVDAGFAMGHLTANRTIMEMAKDGAILRSKAESMTGVHEAFVPFTAEHTKVKGS